MQLKADFANDHLKLELLHFTPHYLEQAISSEWLHLLITESYVNKHPPCLSRPTLGHVKLLVSEYVLISELIPHLLRVVPSFHMHKRETQEHASWNFQDWWRQLFKRRFPCSECYMLLFFLWAAWTMHQREIGCSFVSSTKIELVVNSKAAPVQC